MPDFNDLLNEVKNEVTNLARKDLGGHVNEAKKDAESFLRATEEDFKRWLGLLKNEELTRDDFVWLAKSKKDLLEMFALKQAGLTLVQAEKFGEDLFSVVVDTAFKLIG